MRTMPSDTLMMVPSLRASAPSLNCSMRLLISSLISDGFKVVLDMVAFLNLGMLFQASDPMAGVLFDVFVSAGWPALSRGPQAAFESTCQRRGQTLQATARGAVNHLAAGIDHHAAKQRRVDLGLELDLALEAALERRLQLLGLGGIQRHRAGHLDLQLR